MSASHSICLSLGMVGTLCEHYSSNGVFCISPSGPCSIQDPLLLIYRVNEAHTHTPSFSLFIYPCVSIFQFTLFESSRSSFPKTFFLLHRLIIKPTYLPLPLSLSLSLSLSMSDWLTECHHCVRRCHLVIESKINRSEKRKNQFRIKQQQKNFSNQTKIVSSNESRSKVVRTR